MASFDKSNGKEWSFSLHHYFGSIVEAYEQSETSYQSSDRPTIKIPVGLRKDRCRIEIQRRIRRIVGTRTFKMN